MLKQRCDVLSVAELLQARWGTFSQLCQAVTSQLYLPSNFYASYGPTLLSKSIWNLLCTIIQYPHYAIFSGSQISCCGSALRHYFTYQGQTYSDDFVDIQRRENVGDMQMFLLTEREDIFRGRCIQHALCPTSHDAPESLGTTKRTLCGTQTHHLSSPPSLFSILSLLLPEQVTPAD